MVNSNLLWDYTSLRIDNNNQLVDDFIKLLKDNEIKLREEQNIYCLENQENYFIYEDDFIESTRNLNLVVRKLSQKNYNENGKIYLVNNNDFRLVESNWEDKVVYEEILKDNIINGNIREFPISVNVINEVLTRKTSKSELILDFLILVALSTKITYYAEEIESEFRIDDKSYKINLNIDDAPLHLYALYDWIINNNEYKDSYKVKLQIVRQVIVSKRNIKDINEILEDSKLAYKRIISRKTDDYFEQLNKLKDDFLALSKNANDALKTLNLTFFAWLGSIGVKLLDIITEYNGNDIIPYLLFSKGSKKGVVIAMFIIALIFIFIAYISEMTSLQKEYEVVKCIYKDKILFEEDLDENSKFELIINRPELGKIQLITFGIILFLLIIRCLWSFL